ncbi:hypothetical protein tinsulaeT_27700 [Thalassotalea insulae]|uniref:Uncharacterized protein n=1 Tax=Thalassotalea insulae TaxID=2056778 RepID=A0ABQ6GXG2_9GAMM|nr:hypothetical protein [Thalassotalea insulae]GLX79430.1 hypothetical protein tinsulaeT_27700 [Thalassotalea insulae]
MNIIITTVSQYYLFLYQLKHLSTSQWNMEHYQLSTLGTHRQHKVT